MNLPTLLMSTKRNVVVPPPSGPSSFLLRGNAPANYVNDTFIDSSSNTFEITKTGTPAQGSFSPFPLNGVAYSPSVHGGSAYFDGSSYLTINGNQVLNFGSSNWTVEMWVNLTRIPTADANQMEVIGCGTYNSPDGLLFLIGGQLSVITNNDTFYRSGVSHGLTANTWNHVAYVRNGNVIYFYVNGLQKGSVAFTGSVGTGSNTYIGCETGQMAFVEGYISNLRVVKNTALYTSNFIPSTSPLTNIADTSLLLNFTNGSILDAVGKNDIKLVGDVRVTDNASKYGSGCLTFDGSGDYLTIIPNTTTITSAISSSTSAFTIEMWVKFNVLGGTIFNIENAEANIANWKILGLGVTSSGQLRASIRAANGSSVINYLTYDTLAAKQWYHIALVIDGAAGRLYVDGSLRNSNSTFYSTPYNVASGVNVIGIGAHANNGTGPLDGLIDDLRITKGVARYPSQPFPTAALPNTNAGDPNIADVVLLLQADNITSVPPLETTIDESINDFVITKTGTPAQGSFSPFLLNGANYNPLVNGGSCYFNGSTDYLTIPTNAAFNFSSRTFTIEAWVNFETTAGGQQVIVTNYNSTSTGWALQLYLGKIHVSVSGDGVDITGTTTVVANTWYHVAVSGSFGSYKLFINGSQEGPTYTGSVSLAGGSIGVGALTGRTGYVGASKLKGYISNLRIVNGEALYTSNFSGPTGPVTTISNGGATPSTAPNPNNASLLCNFTNGTFIDSAAGTNLAVNGNTRLSTAIRKYGNASMYFDGTGDYLTSPSKNDFNFETGDFTIECWVNFRNNTATNKIIIEKWAANNGWQIYYRATGTSIAFIANGTVLLQDPSSTTIQSNTWYHIAVTRSSGITTLWINGTQKASAADTTSLTNTFSLTIGAQVSTLTNWMLGNIDDLRIAKGTAIYTEPFSPGPGPL